VRLGVASPLKLSATPVRNRLPPPRLGEHTLTALSDWGIPEQEIQRLHALGVLN
jgi:crotonobetainyl-CoA:carnitine CoA-transferase CaiB-like acyl-CoA transferase